ncbi:hypothetical protein [Nesterenkonia ebinurensis]|uniref:hypothetical protein n=1 Tax=Nesterenkonia ebinurensis TaxID=2608252 RepID=UPI00123E230C|nr:hypothetical protein [Nesterenkonia ebinurensis]
MTSRSEPAEYPARHRSTWSDPGIVLLIVLLVMSAIIFIWWPREPHPGGVALVGWIMFATMPVSIALTGIYVLWMERLEKAVGKDIDEVESGTTSELSGTAANQAES